MSILVVALKSQSPLQLTKLKPKPKTNQDSYVQETFLPITDQHNLFYRHVTFKRVSLKSRVDTPTLHISFYMGIQILQTRKKKFKNCKTQIKNKLLFEETIV